MTVHCKMLRTMRDAVTLDLKRPHVYAHERVAFLGCRFGTCDSGLIILVEDYYPVRDEDYEEDPCAGARINSAAIRFALQAALSLNAGMFHVHLHQHLGCPRPSFIDWAEWHKFVPNFWHVRPGLPHGALIFSADGVSGWCWYPVANTPIPIDRFTFVGRGMECRRLT